MGYYHQLFKDLADESYIFTSADHDAYTEPTDFLTLAGGATGPLKRRIEQVRELQPGGPGF